MREAPDNAKVVDERVAFSADHARERSLLQPGKFPETALAQRKKGFFPFRGPSIPSLSVPSYGRRIAALWSEEMAYGHVFLFVPVLLAMGALTWFSVERTPSFGALVALLCVFGMAALLLVHGGSAWRFAVTAIALFVTGMVAAALETARLDTVLLDSPVTTYVSGTVASREITDRGAWRYIVDVEKTWQPVLKRPPRRISVLARGKQPPIAIGQGIEGRARLSPPSGPALPGLNDFAFDSYFKGTGAVGFFYGAPRPVEISGKRGWMAQLAEQFAAWREAIGARIRGAVEGDTGAIAAALVTDEERAIGRDTVEALRDAGLAHVLAISGLNMVLAAGTFLVGARTLLSAIPGLAHRIAIKKVAAAGALVMVFLYILISGGAVSALRSWIMISIMLIAVFFDRPSISLRNVALSAIIILLVTPSAVTGPGFQMSFAATLALVAGYGYWRNRVEKNEDMATVPKGGLWRSGARFFGAFLAGLFLSSLIGGLSTAIYSAGHFQQLTAYGLAGNMLAMPIISVMVMPFALIAMLLMPFGLELLPLLVMAQGLEWVIAIARMVSEWGGQMTIGRVPTTAFLLIAFGGIVACLLRTPLACIGLAMVSVGLLIAAMENHEQPSLLVSEDGRLVALLDGASVSTNRRKPPDFIFSQWQRALQLGKAEKPEDRPDLVIEDAPSAPLQAVPDDKGRIRKLPVDSAAARRNMTIALEDDAAKNGFVCAEGQWCAARGVNARRIVTVDDVRFLGPACDSADLVIVPATLRVDVCRSGASLVSGNRLRRSGALEMRVAGPSGDIETVAAFGQLQRPWGVHRTYDWRTGRFDDGLPDP